MFEELREKMEVYECDFDLEINGVSQHKYIQAPRMAIEQQFLSLVEQASHSVQPIKIKMSRKIPVFDLWEQKWINRENSVVFTNNVYIKIKGDYNEV